MYKNIITNETMLGFKMKFKQYNNEKKNTKKGKGIQRVIGLIKTYHNL